MSREHDHDYSHVGGFSRLDSVERSPNGSGSLVLLAHGLSAFLTLASIVAVYYSKGDQAIVAFVATSSAALMLLFCCLWLYNSSAQGSLRRNQLKASVWTLTMLLTFSFGYMVVGTGGLTLPVALLVWAIAAATGIGTFSAFFERASITQEAIRSLRDGGRFTWVLVALLFAFFTWASVTALYDSKGDHAIVAFVATSYADLVLLFCCLWLHKVAPQGSAYKGRLKASVRTLTTLLTFSFAYIAMGMAGLTLPVALLVWFIAVATGIGAFFAFFELGRSNVDQGVVMSRTEMTDGNHDCELVAEMTDGDHDSELVALEKALLDESVEPSDLPFSLLKAITGNFSEAQEIGRGGFGVVYTGVLPSGGIVAVKKLFERFEILDKNFESEVSCLVGVKHKNTVRFLGYCSATEHKMMPYDGKLVWADTRQRLLCFEYLPKGCLADYLSDASCRLQWTTRYQIIKGVCEGIHYLHQQRIIHMDLKPQNVLLDDNMVPRIADFGLSRRLSGSQSRSITENKLGTRGYMAPEFINNGEITFKTDIYSLGVIIMEIIMGHKENTNVKEVVESWTNKFGTSKSETTMEQVKVCAEIGIKCMNYDPGNRPTTWFIIRGILGEAEISNWLLQMM